MIYEFRTLSGKHLETFITDDPASEMGELGHRHDVPSDEIEWVRVGDRQYAVDWWNKYSTRAKRVSLCIVLGWDTQYADIEISLQWLMDRHPEDQIYAIFGPYAKTRVWL